MDLHHPGEQRVIAIADLQQVIPPPPQRSGEGRAVLLEVLGRQASHGEVDHRIGEPTLDRPCDRVPHRLLEVHQKPSIGHLAGEREAPDTRIVVAEADQLRPVEPREPHEQAVQARECLVPVSWDGAPDAEPSGIEARPAPLIVMPVPVPDKDVHQPGGEERPGVDPMARVVLEMLEQLGGCGELDRTREPHVVVGRLGGTLFDHSELEAGADAVEAGEPRVIREEREARLGVKDASRVEQRRDHERSTRVCRADLVLDHVAGEGGPQLRWQRQRRILVHRAEHVLAPVPTEEPQRLRLAPAAASGGREAAGEAGQVEHLDVDGRRPQVAVMRTEEQTMQPPCAVARPCDDRLSGGRAGRCPGGLRRDGHRRQRQRRRERQDQGDVSRPAQLSHRANASAAAPRRSTTITPSRARPSRSTSTRMNPLALCANRVPSMAVTRS